MVGKLVPPSKWALVIAQNLAACTYHKNRKKDKILLIDRSTYLAWIKGVTIIFRKAWPNEFIIMITVFAHENIIWYAYFLLVCLVFTPKNVVLSFVLILCQTLHTTDGFFHLQISTFWENRTEERSDGYSWVRNIYFQVNRNSGVELFRRREP